MAVKRNSISKRNPIAEFSKQIIPYARFMPSVPTKYLEFPCKGIGVIDPMFGTEASEVIAGELLEAINAEFNSRGSAGSAVAFSSEDNECKVD